MKKDNLQNLCCNYVCYVALGRIGETLRLQFHQRILDNMADYIDYLPNREDKINDVLHRLDYYIELPIPEFDDPDIVGLKESQIRKYGKALYKQLLVIMAGI